MVGEACTGASCFTSQGAGRHFDLETGESYWVSEVKKNGQDRHRWGSGKVAIEAAAADEYLELIGSTKLDKSRFNIVRGLEEPVPSKFHHLENDGWVLVLDNMTDAPISSARCGILRSVFLR